MDVIERVKVKPLEKAYADYNAIFKKYLQVHDALIRSLKAELDKKK